MGNVCKIGPEVRIIFGMGLERCGLAVTLPDPHHIKGTQPQLKEDGKSCIQNINS